MSSKVVNTLSLVLMFLALAACQNNASELIPDKSSTASSTQVDNTAEQVNKTPMPTLIGAWRVKSIQNEGLLSSTAVRFTFTDKLKFHGLASCNNFSSSYELDKLNLRIKPVAVTRKMCESSVMHQEHKVLTALAQIASYQLKQSTLILVDSQNVALFSATRIKPKK